MYAFFLPEKSCDIDAPQPHHISILLAYAYLYLVFHLDTLIKAELFQLESMVASDSLSIFFDSSYLDIILRFSFCLLPIKYWLILRHWYYVFMDHHIVDQI